SATTTSGATNAISKVISTVWSHTITRSPQPLHRVVACPYKTIALLSFLLEKCVKETILSADHISTAGSRQNLARCGQAPCLGMTRQKPLSLQLPLVSKHRACCQQQTTAFGQSA